MAAIHKTWFGVLPIAPRLMQALNTQMLPPHDADPTIQLLCSLGQATVDMSLPAMAATGLWCDICQILTTSPHIILNTKLPDLVQIETVSNALLEGADDTQNTSEHTTAMVCCAVALATEIMTVAPTTTPLWFGQLRTTVGQWLAARRWEHETMNVKLVLHQFMMQCAMHTRLAEAHIHSPMQAFITYVYEPMWLQRHPCRPDSLVAALDIGIKQVQPDHEQLLQFLSKQVLQLYAREVYAQHFAPSLNDWATTEPLATQRGAVFGLLCDVCARIRTSRSLVPYAAFMACVQSIAMAIIAHNPSEATTLLSSVANYSQTLARDASLTAVQMCACSAQQFVAFVMDAATGSALKYDDDMDENKLQWAPLPYLAAATEESLYTLHAAMMANKEPIQAATSAPPSNTNVVLGVCGSQPSTAMIDGIPFYVAWVQFLCGPTTDATASAIETPAVDALINAISRVHEHITDTSTITTTLCNIIAESLDDRHWWPTRTAHTNAHPMVSQILTPVHCVPVFEMIMQGMIHLATTVETADSIIRALTQQTAGHPHLKVAALYVLYNELQYPNWVCSVPTRDIILTRVACDIFEYITTDTIMGSLCSSELAQMITDATLVIVDSNVPSDVGAYPPPPPPGMGMLSAAISWVRRTFVGSSTTPIVRTVGDTESQIAAAEIPPSPDLLEPALGAQGRLLQSIGNIALGSPTHIIYECGAEAQSPDRTIHDLSAEVFMHVMWMWQQSDAARTAIVGTLQLAQRGTSQLSYHHFLLTCACIRLAGATAHTTALLALAAEQISILAVDCLPPAHHIGILVVAVDTITRLMADATALTEFDYSIERILSTLVANIGAFGRPNSAKLWQHFVQSLSRLTQQQDDGTTAHPTQLPKASAALAMFAKWLIDNPVGPAHVTTTLTDIISWFVPLMWSMSYGSIGLQLIACHVQHIFTSHDMLTGSGSISTQTHRSQNPIMHQVMAEVTAAFSLLALATPECTFEPTEAILLLLKAVEVVAHANAWAATHLHDATIVLQQLAPFSASIVKKTVTITLPSATLINQLCDQTQLTLGAVRTAAHNNSRPVSTTSAELGSDTQFTAAKQLMCAPIQGVLEQMQRTVATQPNIVAFVIALQALNSEITKLVVGTQ
jgi:hypothetical protein